METLTSLRKYCTTCAVLKPLSSFGVVRKNRDGLKYACKECTKIYRRTRPNINDYTRESNLKSNYGLTLQDYNQMFDSQKGRCAICGEHQSELPRRLAVDHNHISKKIRGLLCANCNQGLGFFRDSRGRLLKALQYLGKHK